MKPRRNRTIRDVARVAGVSLGSASRVINQHPSVSAELRGRVERAIRKLQYTPNAVAQSMRNRATRTVGCIVRDITIPVLAEFVRSAQQELDRAGYALLIANSEGRREREVRFLAALAGRKADALLIGQHSEDDRELDGLLKAIGIPVVLVDRESPAWASAVMVDHGGAIKRATEHLLRLGHRRIALVTGDPALFPSRDRIRGYLSAHARFDRAPDPDLVRKGSFLADYGFQQTSALLGLRDPPTALISGGIDMLPGVLRALRARGVVVPRDLSLVAASDSDLAELAGAAISVERWDYSELGRTAARLALDAMRASPATGAQRVLLPSEFLLRDSCAPPPGAPGTPAGAGDALSAAPLRRAS